MSTANAEFELARSHGSTSRWSMWGAVAWADLLQAAWLLGLTPDWGPRVAGGGVGDGGFACRVERLEATAVERAVLLAAVLRGKSRWG